MDPEPIPTEPTTDAEPPVATSVVPGPSLVSDVTGGRSRTRVVVPSRGHRSRAGAHVQRRDRGRKPGGARHGQPRVAGPAPNGTAPTDFGLIQEAWDTLHKQYVGADSSTTGLSSTAPSTA